MARAGPRGRRPRAGVRLILGLVLLAAACRPASPDGRAVPGMDLSGAALGELERRGRQVFIRERCASCHIVGAPPPAVFRGSGRSPGRRIGPTLADVGGRFTDDWHYTFLHDPRALVPTSTMPAYPWLFGADGEPVEDARALVAWLQTQRDPEARRDPEAAIRAAREAPVDGAAGALVYRRNCAGCHGENGEPPEALVARFDPPPADLTATAYALVPRGADGRLLAEPLLGLVARGLGHADMPGHAYLEPGDLASLVDHLRRLGGLHAPDTPPPALDADETEAGTEAGRALWVALGCDGCHGPEGRGDGPQAPETVYDLTGGVLKGPRTPEHVAWVVWRGMPGTAMPAFGPALRDLDPEDALADRLRALVGYVMQITEDGAPVR